MSILSVRIAAAFLKRIMRIVRGPRAWVSIALLVLCLPAAAWAQGEPEEEVLMDTVIFDFSSAEQAEVWRVVNDGVMGGRSQSRFVAHKDSTATFEGSVSLENNGGFASVRSLPWDFSLADTCRGIRVRVRGDGKTYKFRLRLDDNFDGIAYQASFETVTDEWIELELPFDTFKASFRGRSVPDAGPVVPSAIRQFGFLIADYQEGPFRLDVDWIRVWIDSSSH